MDTVELEIHSEADVMRDGGEEFVSVSEPPCSAAVYRIKQFTAWQR